MPASNGRHIASGQGRRGVVFPILRAGHNPVRVPQEKKAFPRESKPSHRKKSAGYLQRDVGKRGTFVPALLTGRGASRVGIGKMRAKKEPSIGGAGTYGGRKAEERSSVLII
jgi:hypothetical protein